MVISAKRAVVRAGLLTLAVAALTVPLIDAASAATPARRNALGSDGPLQMQGAAQRARVVSPEIHPDRRVTVRLNAPNAREVRLTGQLIGNDLGHYLSTQKYLPMTRDANGVWSVTVGPLEPNIYEYAFTVDGLAVNDPQNAGNAVEVSGPTPAYYDTQDVPHGTVRMEIYTSPIFRQPRYVWVYTPPGYDESRDRYPVLYMTHGSNCCESTWVQRGRANIILDNLIAQGKAKPMILAMPLTARSGGSEAMGPNPQHLANAPPPFADPAAQTNYARNNLFEQDLRANMIPWIDRKFRTIPNADNRGFTGLSQGGIQSFNIGLHNPDLFHWVAPQSAGAENQGDEQFAEMLKDVYPNTQSLNQLKLLYITVGDEDVLYEASKRVADRLQARGVKLSFVPVPGRHQMSVWRRGFYDLAQIIFK